MCLGICAPSQAVIILERSYQIRGHTPSRDKRSNHIRFCGWKECGALFRCCGLHAHSLRIVFTHACNAAMRVYNECFVLHCLKFLQRISVRCCFKKSLILKLWGVNKQPPKMASHEWHWSLLVQLGCKHHVHGKMSFKKCGRTKSRSQLMWHICKRLWTISLCLCICDNVRLL